MSRSKEFENILDKCLERLIINGETIEQCLQSFPEYASELKPLLEMTVSAKQVSSIQPRPEFKEKARYQFQTTLQEMKHRNKRPFFNLSWQPRWATLVAVAITLLLIGGGSTVAASGSSMPDNILYPVKLATEQVQLAFTFTDIGKAELNARLADRRIEEIVYLASEGDSEKIELTANRLDTYLTEIAVLSSTQAEMDGVPLEPEAGESLILEAGGTEKESVMTEEPSAEEEAETAITAEETPVTTDTSAGEEAALTTEENGRGNKASDKDNRKSKLKETVEKQANNNNARLRALLETVPDSAKPALEKAIDVSEKGYQKALKALD